VLPIADEAEHDRRPAVVTIGLLLLMVTIGLALGGPERGDQFRELIRQYGLVPSRFWADPGVEWYRLITATLLHGNILHLATNMLFLWVFGRGLEHELRLGFLPFYLVCGLAGGLASAALRAGSDVPGIGASGAISGLLGAYLVLMPNHSIRAIILVPWLFVAAVLRGDRPIWDVPAWAAILTWFGVQVVYLLAPGGARQGTDYAAHVGGFVAGYLLIRLARALFGLWPDEPEYQRVLDRPAGQGVARPSSYIRAVRRIPVGKPIEEADVESVDRAGAYVDPDVVPGHDGKRLIGRRLRQDRYRYEPIRWGDVEPAPSALPEGQSERIPRRA
jgi:membrane associated rhomboid family serine protease